jgi:hypothetical protein
MYPIIDSVTFVTHDNRHVSVANEGGDTITCSWPLCDDKLPTSFTLSDFDEHMLQRLGAQVYLRCERPSDQLSEGSPRDAAVDAYLQILRRLIPSC